MELYVQGPDGEEVDISDALTKPDPEDGTFCIDRDTLIDRLNAARHEIREVGSPNVNLLWLRIVPEREDCRYCEDEDY